MQAPTQHNAAILKTHRNKATLLSGHFLWSGNGERGRLGKLKSQSTIRDLMYLNYKTKSGGKQLYSEGAGNRFPPISTIKMWGLHLEEAAHNALCCCSELTNTTQYPSFVAWSSRLNRCFVPLDYYYSIIHFYYFNLWAMIQRSGTRFKSSVYEKLPNNLVKFSLTSILPAVRHPTND